jgi:hypothetical protein
MIRAYFVGKYRQSEGKREYKASDYSVIICKSIDILGLRAGSRLLVKHANKYMLKNLGMAFFPKRAYFYFGQKKKLTLILDQCLRFFLNT